MTAHTQHLASGFHSQITQPIFLFFGGRLCLHVCPPLFPPCPFALSCTASTAVLRLAEEMWAQRESLFTHRNAITSTTPLRTHGSGAARVASPICLSNSIRWVWAGNSSRRRRILNLRSCKTRHMTVSMRFRPAHAHTYHSVRFMHK